MGCFGQSEKSVASCPLEQVETEENGVEYDNVLDDKIVEKFLMKSLCSGDVKTSLLCVMMSPGCKDAFYKYLKKVIVDMVARAEYIKNLEVFFDQYCLSGGNCKVTFGSEWCYQHAVLVTGFVSDKTYKRWRAVESANVLSAMNVFAVDGTGLPSQYLCDDNCSEDNCSAEDSSSARSSVCSIRSVSSVSVDALQSVRCEAVDSISSGSVWLVQYLSIMEDFPLPFTLAKVTKTHGLQSTPIVYANKSFEKMSNQNRWDIVRSSMEGGFSAPSSHEMADCELVGEYVPYWQTGFNGAYAPVSIQAAFKFGSFNSQCQGTCVASMKPIYAPSGELLYIASFYEPLLMKSASCLAATCGARRRNVKFLNSLPSIVNEHFDKCLHA
jgi:hypothetical protein